MELIEKNNVNIGGKCILVATKKGTRKFGPYQELYAPDGHRLFRGRPIIDLGEIVATRKTHNIYCDEGLLLLTSGPSTLFVLEHYNHTIDDNIVNDKPLLYLKNSFGTTVTAGSYGQVILFDCNH